MGASIYGNVGGTARKASRLYGNVGGANRKLKSLWANVNGVSRKIFSDGVKWTYTTELDLGSGQDYYSYGPTSAYSAYSYAYWNENVGTLWSFTTYTFSKPIQIDSLSLNVILSDHAYLGEVRIFNKDPVSFLYTSKSIFKSFSHELTGLGTITKLGIDAYVQADNDLAGSTAVIATVNHDFILNNSGTSEKQ